jgi:hypothetical protein
LRFLAFSSYGDWTLLLCWVLPLIPNAGYKDGEECENGEKEDHTFRLSLIHCRQDGWTEFAENDCWRKQKSAAPAFVNVVV